MAPALRSVSDASKVGDLQGKAKPGEVLQPVPRHQPCGTLEKELARLHPGVGPPVGRVLQMRDERHNGNDVSLVRADGVQHAPPMLPHTLALAMNLSKGLLEADSPRSGPIM